MQPTFAIGTSRALLAVTPMLCFGGYLVFAAAYCYRKGEVGFKSPITVKRTESPVRFLFGVIWLALGGVAFISLAVYWSIRAVR